MLSNQSTSRPASARKRGFVRGLTAAVVAYLLALAVFAVLFHYLKPFVWFALSTEPYSPASEPLDPNSTEWLVIQGGNFITWVVAGYAASRWSSRDRKHWIIALGLLVLLLPSTGPELETDSFVRHALWWLTSPFGLAFGTLLQSAREQNQLINAQQVGSTSQ